MRFYDDSISRHKAPAFLFTNSKQFLRLRVIVIIYNQKCVKATRIDEYSFHLHLEA